MYPHSGFCGTHVSQDNLLKKDFDVVHIVNYKLRGKLWLQGQDLEPIAWIGNALS